MWEGGEGGSVPGRSTDYRRDSNSSGTGNGLAFVVFAINIKCGLHYLYYTWNCI